jgi:hypothetical protein
MRRASRFMPKYTRKRYWPAWFALAILAFVPVYFLYKALVQEIEDCQASMKPDALTSPFRDAQRDPEYVEARRAAQAELADCDRELARP